MTSLLSRGRLQLSGALLALATVAMPAHPAEPDVITYAAPGSISSSLAPYFYARELGYLTQENLKLDVVILQGSGEIIPQLVKGSITASMITPDVLISSRQPGRPNFPLHFVYNVFRKSVWQIAVLENSPLQAVKDLKGKTVGVGALTFANVVQTKSLLRRNDIDPSGTSFVAVGSGGPALEALRTGKIDALNHHVMLLTQLEAQGTKIRRLPYPPEFADISSHGLIFSDKVIKERPDLIVRFGRVLAKGTVACKANPDACLSAYWAAYPEQKPSDSNATPRERRVLAVAIDTMTAFPAGGPTQFGRYDERDWSATVDSLKQGGEVAAGSNIPLESLYTNQFIDEINKFDAAAVVRQAKAN